MEPGFNATASNILSDLRVHLRTYTALAALTVLVYEWVATLHDEITLVWTRPVSIVKCLFVVSRYLGLFAQIASQILFFTLDPESPLSRRQCIAWHTFQTIAFQILLFVVECIQAMKVHALYSDRPKALKMLHTFRVLALVMATYSTATTIELLSYTGACIVSEIPWQVMGFSATAIFCQMVVAFLGLSPRTVKEIWRQSSLIAIMTRDSFFAFFAVTALLTIMISHAHVLAHIISPVFITTLSISGSRMILHMLSRASMKGQTIKTGSVHLTMYLGGSIIELGESTQAGPSTLE